ncbi:MAG: TonB-dependent receptor, partial [Gemmatimonadota bacterium]
DATLTSTGLFAQDRWRTGRATDLTVGARYQDVRATATGGTRHVDRTVVGSVSVVHFVRSDVALIGSAARGFRSPNLVERFFSGPTPGGRGVWVRNPGLAAETSLSLDLGARLRRPGLEAELFVHRTSLRNGIRVEPTGRETGSGPEYRNENVESLVVRGLEAWGRWNPLPALTVTASVEVLDRLNPRDPEDPLEGGTRTRLQGRLSWTALPDRLTLAYHARWHGGRRAPEGGSPVGPSVPAFHVHDLHADILLADGHRLALGVENLTDRLWARPENVDFFRPEPGRRLVVALTSHF